MTLTFSTFFSAMTKSLSHWYSKWLVVVVEVEQATGEVLVLLGFDCGRDGQFSLS